MDLFEQKPIFLDEATVAEQLRRVRQSKELKLETVAKKLNIRAEYLEALEKGHYDRLPTGVYGRNFLREYCRFLGLDYRPLAKQFEAEAKASIRGNVFERRLVAKRDLLALPVLARNAIIGVLIAACLIYLGLLLKRIFEPPFLAIEYPTDNLTTADNRLTVRGRTEPETEITINNENVVVTSSGAFERDVFLQPGLNTIAVTAEKKYSRPATLLRQVLVESPPEQ